MPFNSIVLGLTRQPSVSLVPGGSLVLHQGTVTATVTDPVAVPPLPHLVRFTFLTPYLLAGDTDLEAGFNDTELFMQLIRRISSLQHLYTCFPLLTDYRNLKSLTVSSLILDANFTVQNKYSYGKSDKKFNAVRGECIMSLEKKEELWPWLYLGQFLNVGKLAGKGFGRYTLTAVDVQD